MAEPLKNSFGPEVVENVASMVAAVIPQFPRRRFVDACLDGFDELELTPRAQQISDVLADVLPADRGAALDVLIEALVLEGPPRELHGMEGFRYLPIVFFVADHGLDHFERAMTLQYELTKRFTAEFSIRAYLEHLPDDTLDRLREWTDDPSEHVRRLVSEGTRPRLPWARRLRTFMADPTPVVELLELLNDDESEYVRRSVANNLNDIAKDHPDLVVDIARRWWHDADADRRRLVKHGLRTLIKQGDPGALDVIGYGADSPIEIVAAGCDPNHVTIGGSTRVWVDVRNPSSEERGALIDFKVHFVKANGSASPKVFKGAEVVVQPSASATVRTKVSLAVHSTRTPYPGEHAVDVLINGVEHTLGTFTVVASPPASG